jgi:hypothetical protein
MDMFPETAETKYTGIGLKCWFVNT